MRRRRSSYPFAAVPVPNHRLAPMDPRCLDCGAAGVMPVAWVVGMHGGHRAVLGCRRHADERRMARAY